MKTLLACTIALAMQVPFCVAQDVATNIPSDETHKPFAVAAISDLVHGAWTPTLYNDADRNPWLAQEQENKPKVLSPQGDTQTSPAIAQSPGSAGTGASLSRPAGNRPGTLEGVGNLTYKGITFYGNIDIGAQYQTHGASYNDDAPQTGLQQVIVKNSNHALIHYSQNGMSQSVLGVRGDINLGSDIALIFKLEPGVEPMDGFRWTNSVKSLAENDGVAIQDQTANFDTNRGGRIDNGEAFFGFEKKVADDKFLTLTFGRVISVVSDKVSKYDFDSGAYAFSLISYQGIVSGGGDSEDLRLDSALKFTSQFGRYRISGLTQFSGRNSVFQPDGVYGSNRQLDLGYDWNRLSTDVVYVGVRDGISATYLSAAQAAVLPKDSLAATISDNTSYAVMSRYRVDRAGRLRAFGGFNHIRYRNPLIPLKTGITTIGGFDLSVLTQNAYTVNKILTASWLGAQYSITPRLSVSGGWYQFHQNSYSGNGCSNNSSAQCSGSLNVMPILFAYELNKSVDLYGGSEGSFVTAGYSNGYLHTTDVTVAVGGRYHF
jgi:predicted porin